MAPGTDSEGEKEQQGLVVTDSGFIGLGKEFDKSPQIVEAGGDLLARFPYNGILYHGS